MRFLASVLDEREKIHGPVKHRDKNSLHRDGSLRQISIHGKAR